MPIWRSLKRTVGRLPIYGALFLARSESRKDAAKELSVATLFSLFPIWLCPVFLLFTDASFWETARSCVESGELYLYSAALMGPLIYSVSKRYDVNGGDASSDSALARQTFPRVPSLRFPYGIFFSVFAIIVCCVAAVMFAFIRARTDIPPAVDLNGDATLSWSVSLYAITLSCVFCVLVYRLELEHIPNRFSEGTKELAKQWRGRN